VQVPQVFGGVRFTDAMLRRSPAHGWDAVATLAHFAMVTYAVPPDRVRPHVDTRFELDTFLDRAGNPRVWVSMVAFEDQNFHFAPLPWLRFRFGQTNYRTYVVDRVTRRRGVWFFGTTLDSWSVVLPRYLWQLPWHRGHIQFDCDYDSVAGHYTRYAMQTRSAWAPVELRLEDTGETCSELEAMDDFEAAEVVLTHPLEGFFQRRDGGLGHYSVWHDRLNCKVGKCKSARIDLFDRLQLVPFAEQANPYSVLITHSTEFTIYLPPARLGPVGV